MGYPTASWPMFQMQQTRPFHLSLSLQPSILGSILENLFNTLYRYHIISLVWQPEMYSMFQVRPNKWLISTLLLNNLTYVNKYAKYIPHYPIHCYLDLFQVTMNLYPKVSLNSNTPKGPCTLLKTYTTTRSPKWCNFTLVCVKFHLLPLDPTFSWSITLCDLNLLRHPWFHQYLYCQQTY